MMLLKIKKIHPDAVIPKYANYGDAGLDLFSIEDHVINPGDHLLVKTGLQMELPMGFEAQIRPKSGLALKNRITVLNSPATIDSGYRGELGIIIINHGDEDFEIKKGEKIAQMVIAKHEIAEIMEVEELFPSQRGTGGFGSTGKR